MALIAGIAGIAKHLNQSEHTIRSWMPEMKKAGIIFYRRRGPWRKIREVCVWSEKLETWYEQKQKPSPLY